MVSRKLLRDYGLAIAVVLLVAAMLLSVHACSDDTPSGYGYNDCMTVSDSLKVCGDQEFKVF